MENSAYDFFEFDNEIKDYSGNVFELLVEIILRKLYPQYSFTRTSYSHDGGKDFYAINGDTSIWAEAKCHKRHLELGRIAGTFIMAELCKINRIIIFSLSDLTSGAINNLTKFTSRNGQQLIVFNNSDIRTLIRSFGTMDTEEIIDLIGETYDINNETASYISSNNLNKITHNLIQMKKEYKQLKKEAKIQHEKNLSLYLTIYAYMIFNKFAKSDDDKDEIPSEVKVLNKQFYLQNDSATAQNLKTEIRAFDVFVAEIILRNEDVFRSKKVSIEFEKLTTHYAAVTPSIFEGVLLAGQSIALNFYFKALNISCNLTLPQPCVWFENKMAECAMTHNNVSAIPCRIAGEVPYFGEDSNKLSQLNQDLESERNFACVLIHGKSGVGKSRFLYELQTACLRKGNRCYIFHGDNANNSVLDFIRQLLYAYYNISFVGQENKIVMPEALENLAGNSKFQKYIEFLNACLNCNSEQEINLLAAQNWLADVLKCDKTTLIIDNVQQLDKKVLGLLSKVISDLKNCNCKSEIILTFNTDLIVNGTAADNFFKHLKCVLTDKFKICLKGFNEINAADYLKYSLDPQDVRKDLGNLCKTVAARVQNNPLFLKQIVLYLLQNHVIGFLNDTLCILNHAKLIEELNSLPDTVFDIMRARYHLLIKNAGSFQTQIQDLFWSILIFGNLPEKYVYYIENFEISALNICVELGFIKHGANNTLVFEHQLIAKSVLLLLEGKTYNSHPIITKLGLSASTAKCFLQNILSKKHNTALFAIKENYVGITLKDFTRFLPELSLNEVSEMFIQYVVDLICGLISKYNADIQTKLKIATLYLLIRKSQDRQGVQKTAELFGDIIYNQVENYQLNAPCAEEFIELLKYYMYQLPTEQKDAFLTKMKKIGQDLLSSLTDKTKKDDFDVWIFWAFGKNAVQLYKFEEAKKILNSGVTLAKSKNNAHRLAELEIQLGYLYSYLEDKEQTRVHWNEACLNFSGMNFYETVLNYVYKGNVELLKGNFTKSNAMCDELNKLYESKDSYDYLKSISNDFISNSLILEFVDKGEYSQNKIEEIIFILERFRTLTLMYDINAYLHAAYKSLVFYKYLLENFKLFIHEDEYNKYKSFIYIISEELLCNYEWNPQNFEFFYPIFKDIASAVGKDKIWFDYFVNKIPQDRRKLFLSLCSQTKQKTAYAPKLRRGIFNDSDDKINLFHYTYRW